MYFSPNAFTLKGIRRIAALFAALAALGPVRAQTPAPLSCPDAHEAGALHGAFTPDSAFILDCGRWTLALRADSVALAPGAEVVIDAPRVFARLQKASPAVQGYVSASCSAPGATATVLRVRAGNQELFPLWDADKDATVITVGIGGAGLALGDTLFVHLGAAGAGQACLMRTAHRAEARVAFDAEPDGHFRELRERPALRIDPGVGTMGVAYLPSVADSGRSVLLQTKVYDKFYNPASGFSGAWAVTSTDPAADLPGFASFSPADAGKRENYVRFRTPGVHYVTFTPVAGGLPPFRSNPVRVKAHPGPGWYWGEFHTHSEYSRDAIGEAGFRKGRDDAGLDFFAPTEHSHTGGSGSGLNCREWSRYVDEALAYDEPGRFTTFLGYETSFPQPLGGHHNHLFTFDAASVEQVPVYWDAPSMDAIWAQSEAWTAEGVGQLSIPHHTGKWFNVLDSGRMTGVSFGPGTAPARFRRLIEIYSNHGQSERYDPADPLAYEFQSSDPLSASIDGPHYAQDAWAAGERLGVIASSDDHSARGGTPRLGLFAVQAPYLQRDAIWAGLMARRSYGTTGDRMLLDFSADGTPMGSALGLAPGDTPRLRFEAWGTEPLLGAWILRWPLDGSGTWSGGHPVFDTVAFAAPGPDTWSLVLEAVDPAFGDSALYYARVVQESRHGPDGRATGWTSPIWVHRTACPVPTGGVTCRLPDGRVRLCWDPVPGASYRLCGGPLDAAERCAVTTGTCVTLSNLNEGVDYRWRVQALCGAGPSAEGPERFFRLVPGQAGCSDGAAARALPDRATLPAAGRPWPNPAREAVFWDPGVRGRVLLLGPDGRTLREAAERSGVRSVPLAGLPAGTYALAVRSPEGRLVTALVQRLP